MRGFKGQQFEVGEDINNIVHVRNIYPEAGGPTVATRGSSLTPYVAGQFKYVPGMGGNTLVPGGAIAAPAAQADNSPAANGNGGGLFGRPFTWWFVLVALLIALMWGAQRFGSEGEDFKNVRHSLYNVAIISLAAMIGFGLFKVIFGKLRVPGLSDYVAAV